MNLDGTWRPLLARLSGVEFEGTTLQSMELTIQGDNFIAAASGQTDKGKIKVNEALSPVAMDIVSTDGPNVGKVIWAVCKFSNGKLTICYSLEKGRRPTDFTSTTENKHFLVVYQRDTSK